MKHEPVTSVPNERVAAFEEVLREEAILARLDPDRLGRDLPPDMPESARADWEHFVAECDRLEAERAPRARRGESDRSAGCL